MNNMTLEEAIDVLENMISDYVIGEYCASRKCSNFDNCEDDCYFEKAIDTVLRAIKIKDEYLKMISFVLTNPYECMSLEDIVGDIEDAKAYCVMGLNNDDESVIGLNGKKNFNILHEEVEDE